MDIHILVIMSLLLICIKRKSPFGKYKTSLLFSILLSIVSPGTLLLIACLCIVANGGVCSSRTSAGNCIWLVSVCTMDHIMSLSAVSI